MNNKGDLQRLSAIWKVIWRLRFESGFCGLVSDLANHVVMKVPEQESDCGFGGDGLGRSVQAARVGSRGDGERVPEHSDVFWRPNKCVTVC